MKVVLGELPNCTRGAASYVADTITKEYLAAGMRVVEGPAPHRMVGRVHARISDCFSWFGNDGFEGSITLTLVGDGRILTSATINVSDRMNNKQFETLTEGAQYMARKTLEAMPVQSFALDAAQAPSGRPGASLGATETSREQPSHTGGCTSDRECKAGRRCYAGVCRNPAEGM